VALESEEVFYQKALFETASFHTTLAAGLGSRLRIGFYMPAGRISNAPCSASLVWALRGEGVV